MKKAKPVFAKGLEPGDPLTRRGDKIVRAVCLDRFKIIGFYAGEGRVVEKNIIVKKNIIARKNVRAA